MYNNPSQTNQQPHLVGLRSVDAINWEVYEGPRNTKCTGCGGAPGAWGFAPFGNLPGKQGVTVRIYVAPARKNR